MAEVAIVGQAWLPRVLVKAQLEEEGHSVTGFETLADLLTPVRLGLISPKLIIVDTLGLALDREALCDLHQTSRAIPVLMLSGPFDAHLLGLEARGFSEVLLRPIKVGDVARRVSQALARR